MNSKLLLLLIFYLIISSSFQSRILREENENEEKDDKEDEDEQKSCDDEDETDTSQKEVDVSNISQNKIKKENMPNSQVLLPLRRVGTSKMEIGIEPCGGIEKKQANTLTNKGSSINFIWEILVPENSGNCTVKISNGIQDKDNFKLLKPVDGNINKDGSFICGREKGFEHKEFLLPKDYECDGCTLQWKWSTPYGDIYSCSDIIINGGSLNKCLGKCLNGGSCFNGECLCINGFTGEFCEEKGRSSSKTFLWVLLGILCTAGLIYLIYKFIYPFLYKKWTDGWLKEDINKVSNPFHEDPSNRNIPEFESNRNDN